MGRSHGTFAEPTVFARGAAASPRCLRQHTFDLYDDSQAHDMATVLAALGLFTNERRVLQGFVVAGMQHILWFQGCGGAIL
ncbi:MAG: hypothetical protein WDN01_18645 [Rhizomicrobium sp.]